MRALSAWVAALALPVFLALAAPAAAQTSVTLVSNTGQTDSDSVSVGLNFDRYVGQAFTTGGNTAGYTLSAVDVRLGSTAHANTQVSIYTTSSDGLPDSSLHVLNNPSSLTVNAINTFTAAAGVTLAANTTYAVVINIDLETLLVTHDTILRLTTSASEDANPASGWSIADEAYLRDFVGSNAHLGWREVSSKLKPRIAIKGYERVPRPPPDTAPSFRGATVAALTLDRGAAMAPVTLPRAFGGNGSKSYSLTSEPAGLAGLTFDPATRRLTGTPGRAGSWTFTYRADDRDSNRRASDAAIQTFTVQVSILGRAVEAVKRTLAGVATRTLTSALGHIGARFAEVVPSGGLTLAGQPVNLAVPAAGPHGACPSGGFDRHGLGNAFGRGISGSRGGCKGWSRSVGADELLHASAFSLTLGAAEGSGGFDPAMPRWSVWGRGDYATFAGRPEGIRYDGEATSGWLGVDARAGRWVAGLALSHGVSEADYRYEGGDATAGRSRLETTLTALYPYGRWTIGEGLELRGVLGAGTGEARHVLEDGERETGDLGMRMASAGMRQELSPVAGIDLAARADASVVWMEVDDGPEIIAGVSADSWRVRLGLEASRRFALAEEAALTPFVEAVGRRDGGDGLVGSGLEMAGGVRYSAQGVEVEARGRMLVAHAEEGARERGVSVTARAGPGADGRGLSLSLAPRWGAAAGGAQALWRDEMPRLSATGGGNEAVMDARIGYGFAPAERGVLTPFAETGLAGGENRRFRLGTRFDASHMDLGVELSGERRESGNADPEHALRLDLMLRF